MDDSPATRAASATASASPPESLTRAARPAANPVAMPTCMESTHVTGTDACFDASTAESSVPDILALRCTETMAVAPSSASRSYTARKSSGVGREVLTGTKLASASAIMSDVTSWPSV